jgi:hypothetical protein
MLKLYSTFFYLLLAPALIFAFEEDGDFLYLPKPPPPPQSVTAEGTIESVTDDGDTYDEEQTDDGDWYYGKNR